MIFGFPDGTCLSAYQLKDGSKLNLILKREAATPTPGSGPSNKPCSKENENVGSLEEELYRSLRKHFKSDIDTKTVVSEILRVIFQLISFTIPFLIILSFLFNLDLQQEIGTS